MTPQTIGVNFGDQGMYSGGAFIPDGKYCVYHDVVLHQPVDKVTNAPKGKPILGVQVSFYPLENPVEEAKLTKLYGMGSKAYLSFAPNPETGKGLVLVPGGPAATFNDKTNWFLYLDSFYQCGMPKGVFTNDCTSIDGTWVYVKNVDEPAERAGFASQTAEVEQELRKPGKIPIVSEILEGGAPWEGGGGFPASPAVATPTPARPVAVPPRAPASRPVAAAAPAAPAPRPPAARPPARPAAAATAPAPVAAAGVDTEDLKNWASAAMSDVITAKPNGLPRTILRNETFKYLEKQAGADIAGSVINNYFEAGMEANLSAVLGELGYSLQGPQVKPLQ